MTTHKRGIWVIDEEELTRLLQLPEGQRVVGVRDDWQRMSILVCVEGDGLPEVTPGTEAPIVGYGVPGLKQVAE